MKDLINKLKQIILQLSYSSILQVKYIGKY